METVEDPKPVKAKLEKPQDAKAAEMSCTLRSVSSKQLVKVIKIMKLFGPRAVLKFHDSVSVSTTQQQNHWKGLQLVIMCPRMTFLLSCELQVFNPDYNVVNGGFNLNGSEIQIEDLDVVLKSCSDTNSKAIALQFALKNSTTLSLTMEDDMGVNSSELPVSRVGAPIPSLCSVKHKYQIFLSKRYMRSLCAISAQQVMKPNKAVECAESSKPRHVRDAKEPITISVCHVPGADKAELFFVLSTKSSKGITQKRFYPKKVNGLKTLFWQRFDTENIFKFCKLFISSSDLLGINLSPGMPMMISNPFGMEHSRLLAVLPFLQEGK